MLAKQQECYLFIYLIIVINFYNIPVKNLTVLQQI